MFVFFNLFTLSFIIFENEKIIDIKKFFSFYIFFFKGDETLHSCFFHVLNIHFWEQRESIHKSFLQSWERSAPIQHIPSLFCNAIMHVWQSISQARERSWFRIGVEDFLALIPRLVKRWSSVRNSSHWKSRKFPQFQSALST